MSTMFSWLLSKQGVASLLHFLPEGSWISNRRAAAKEADAVNSPELCLAFYLHHVISFLFFHPTQIYLSTSYVLGAGATR